MNEKKLTNIVYDADYTNIVPDGWFPNTKENKSTKKKEEAKDILSEIKKSVNTIEKSGNKFFTNFTTTLFPSLWIKNKENTDDKKSDDSKSKAELKSEDKIDPKLSLKDQVKKLLQMKDQEYSDSKLTSELRTYIAEVEKEHNSIISDYKTHISPSYWEFKANNFNVSGIFWRTYYVQSYPSYMDALWTRDLFSFHNKWDMSFFIYPEDDSDMQSMLKQKATQLKAEINESLQKGITLDKELEQQYKDVEMIREKLTTHEEKYFETGCYTNLYHDDEAKLKEQWRKFEQKIWGLWIRAKNAIQRMDEWYNSCLPLCNDDLAINRSAISSSLAWSFPFISSDLTSNTGILYWVNSYTGWLVIFDRFNSELPNMNSCILATSGAWKSFTVKLEILRYLLNGIDAIVIDPENEYKELCEKVGWTYINIATSSQQHLNPFDIPPKIEDVDYGKWDLLRSQIMSLISLIKLLVWDLSPQEEAVLDKALQGTYNLKWFSLDEEDYSWKQPPLMEDLMNVLEWMDWWENISLKLSKYVTWTFGKIFNNYTNVDINNVLTVFSIRDLEEALKTPAMFNVLNFIRTKIRSQKKQRLLAVDEAWILLQKQISAEFLFGLIKRARKYWVGITTISQDIEDFVNSPYGKPILSNSALQILLKQSTSSIKSLNNLLWLSEAEQRRLVACGIGEWLMFAGAQHVGLKILASPDEELFIKTDIKKTSI